MMIDHVSLIITYRTYDDVIRSDGGGILKVAESLSELAAPDHKHSSVTNNQ